LACGDGRTEEILVEFWLGIGDDRCKGVEAGQQETSMAIRMLCKQSLGLADELEKEVTDAAA
jgi:hypothetical protein